MLLSSQPDMQVVDTTADGCDAIALATEQRPDLAILDLGMPGCNGIEAAQEIRTRCPVTRVLALSMHADGCFVRRMVDAGPAAMCSRLPGRRR